MKNIFLSNCSDLKFIDKLKDSLNNCKAFYLSISFIKKAGLVLIEREIENALDRGVKGKIITSTYQNFTDIVSLQKFYEWQNKYNNFECHLDFENFSDSGFHSKGYIFEYDDCYELIIGSTNITRFALLKNIEWNVSLINKETFSSYNASLKEFNYLWNKTLELEPKIIDMYRLRLDFALEKWDMDYVNPNALSVNPNFMQRKALKELRRYRDTGVEKALIISATGSGKTYLAAFDARNFSAKRLLYVVHRDTILNDAKNTFMNVFGAEKSYGLYTGKDQDLDCDFVFASSIMLSKHFNEFAKDEFDYIIYDEVHHIVADCGKKIFNYFKPNFLLGLTATPERMDNKDIFDLFDQNVPFELRLRDAINNNLVVPFHYYGIRTKLADYKHKDRMKVAKEIAKLDNVEFITSEIEKHRKSGEKLKALAFCTNIQHCTLMAEILCELGYNTVALTGKNDLGERIKAFKDLQDESNKLEIICAVDILNEGIDIPGVNMVLFLRPTESQTIFLQQLGRGLRKYPGKEYVTVLDFIGNNYDRSIQIALALGTLGKTSYMEKAYLKDLIRTDFASINIPNVIIDIDDLSKEEIINYIDNTNFNNMNFLKKDYENFKKYINSQIYPSHMDYLDYEIAPDFIRFIKASMRGSKNKSYYNFLNKIGEDIPLFNEDEINIIDSLEEMLPLVRPNEYLIVKQLIKENKIDLDKINESYSNIELDSLVHALNNLKKKSIIGNSVVDLTHIGSEYKEYLLDVINYGLTKYETEFGNFNGKFKLYGNYYKEQTALIEYKSGVLNSQMVGTYFGENGETYCFVGLKKDIEGKLNYKDKFVSSDLFQWESKNNTTRTNAEGIKLLNTKKVHLFVRKMEKEDNITLPFTYFGTGIFENLRDSYVEENNIKIPTLLFDIKLDNVVPKEYYLDFNIPESKV